ncbi:MAG: chromosome segregation protein SMC, partial [Candidatus Omnitrophica bacterium]|nr:chromosome segregation protein SMC [Candidatus Omnitrophota bacterium]
IPVQLDRDIARFLGYVLSEGRNTTANQVWFVNSDEALIKDFASCVKNVFGLEAKVFSYKENTKDVLVYSHALCKFLDRVFGIGIGEKSSSKRIPKQIFGADDEIAAEFLSALFEGDGYISADRKGGKNCDYIEYSTASCGLAEDIATLLLRFGTQSVIREKLKAATNTRDKKKRKYYSVYVYGINNIKQLVRRLDFVGVKAARLKSIENANYTGNPNLDLIPEVNKLVKLLVKETKINVKKLRKTYPKLSAYYENRCYASREGLNEVLCVIEEHGRISTLARLILDHLKNLARSDIYWDEIVKIERVKGPEWVYDLTVEGHHNFVANDIIVHNSNIIDAIKWVLGEQSVKSLRGSAMEDVIFNGTDDREPINMAEVSLTLSNKDRNLSIDVDEVVVSRRLFRSGESEYLINKAPVRLKDVNELFMGTGIGAEAYSIVEQGKIDLIISSRPEDRRFIFEEASGITKYKSKRREAVRKLEDTDNNLLRVNDIVTEVKRQIDSITRQARKAERYKERFDRLKDLESKSAFYEYEILKREREEKESEASEIKDEISKISRDIEDLSSNLESERISFAGIDAKFAQLQNSKFSKESLIEQNKNKIIVDKERIAELSARIESLRAEITSIESRHLSAQKLIEALENEFAIISDLEGAKVRVLEDEEKRLLELEAEIRTSEKNVIESRKNLINYMAERSKSKNEVIKLTSDIQNRSVRLRRLSLEAEKVEEEAKAAKEKLAEADRDFKDTENRLNNIRAEKDRILGEKEALLTSVRASEDELQKERDALIKLESKKSFLEDLIKKHEGFTGGTKALLESLDSGDLKIEGIEGVLGNMVEAKRGFERAAEAALGDYIQCIVAKDRESALKAVEYLETTKKGRATFIVSNEITDSNEAPASHLSKDDIVGRLSDFITAKDSLKKVVAGLLGNTYLVESVDKAEKILHYISPDSSANVRLVTKKGEVLARGFIAGGSGVFGEDEGIIGRELRLKEASSAIESTRDLIGKMEAAKGDLSAKLLSLEEKIVSLESILREEEAEYHSKKSRLSSVGEEDERLSEELSLLNLEREEIQDEVNDISSKKNDLEKCLVEIEAEENNTHNLLVNSEEAIKNISREREEIVILITKVKTEIQAISKEKVTLSQNIEAQRESFNTYSLSLAQKKDEIESSVRRADELSSEIEELGAEVVELSNEAKTITEEIARISANKEKNSSAIEMIEKRLAELYKLSNEDKDKDHNLNMKSSEISFKAETLRNRMAQLYKVDIDHDKVEYDPSSNWESFRGEIEELKRKLESMGTVNLVAIEEHKELEDRFNFLSQQREDLVKAKESLKEAISKINKTTRKLFMETFEKIQFEFKNYFRYLFGGGQAEVFLLDEHDVLESGIEIAVRPPGKRLQSITLLSGGEKALTAISLIFAIFKVKPSPFCLLDEVDAPLDESNVERFTKAIREFTKTSQFIVVTHNKRTITMADVMYGITMEKSGISKIVSVKFHDEARAQAVASEEKEKEPVRHFDGAQCGLKRGEPVEPQAQGSSRVESRDEEKKAAEPEKLLT